MKTALILVAASLAFLTPVRSDASPMQAARENAAKALANLQNATTDKGGYRVAAIKHLKAALEQIDAGVAFDQANTTKGEGKKKGKK